MGGPETRTRVRTGSNLLPAGGAFATAQKPESGTRAEMYRQTLDARAQEAAKFKATVVVVKKKVGEMGNELEGKIPVMREMMQAKIRPAEEGRMEEVDADFVQSAQGIANGQFKIALEEPLRAVVKIARILEVYREFVDAAVPQQLGPLVVDEQEFDIEMNMLGAPVDERSKYRALASELRFAMVARADARDAIYALRPATEKALLTKEELDAMLQDVPRVQEGRKAESAQAAEVKMNQLMVELLAFLRAYESAMGSVEKAAAKEQSMWKKIAGVLQFARGDSGRLGRVEVLLEGFVSRAGAAAGTGTSAQA